MAVTYGALECRQSASQRTSPGTVGEIPKLRIKALRKCDIEASERSPVAVGQ
jgi:hypothetical protein